MSEHVRKPILTAVSGPPGTGKTTLAHALAHRIGCPALCRDEIKEGMTLAAAGGAPSAELNIAANTAFFDTLRALLGAGTTLVAEAAFQDRLWRQPLQHLMTVAAVRVVRCTTNADVAYARITHRLCTNPGRKAHDDRAFVAQLDSGELSIDSFVPISLDVPTSVVDTTDGYAPSMDEIVQFAKRRAP